MNPAHRKELLFSLTSTQLETAYRHCERLARNSGSNFYCAFLSLPRPMFREMCVLYSFMRVTDNIGDDEDLELSLRRQKLLEWRTQVHEAFDTGTSSEPILLALRDVAARKEIPLERFLDVIDGVESDLVPRRFQTFDQLEHYCYQVAGAVGLCCIGIWGYSGQDAEQFAIDCGTAFQLTNILRDLSEDSERGRLYLPLEDLEQFNYSPDDLADQRQSPSFKQLMEFEVERAWSYYRKALPLLECVSPDGRRILRGFFGTYSELLHEIEHRNYDVFSGRVRLSRWKKWSVAMRSLLSLPVKFTIPELPQPANSLSTSD
ncbi:All-trans-phytoene synthase [Thalassoglobus neptunius]|uniref:All-trans-phytoene synthase n=1 Tax=Thalassoglobus neptunius TaxID=1938619 RepID=A0A5C5WXY8_9PLAN|nr:phytoene/squalene synthase family protein [Thalassoglobus neptunius]TWT55824.1 All-trans-phytoene synthase [Thalassoglobus neptunius]